MKDFTTIEEYDAYMAYLDSLDFYAEMSDDYSVTIREHKRIAENREKARKRKIELGL